MISHDDYFHCSSILSLLTVLSSLYSFSLHPLITPAIILSEEQSHSLTVYVSAWNKAPRICMVFCFTQGGGDLSDILPQLLPRVHHPPFFHDGWLVSERQGLQRESLMLQGSTVWLMDFTLIHSDPSPSDPASATFSCSSARWTNSFRLQLKVNCIFYFFDIELFCKSSVLFSEKKGGYGNNGYDTYHKTTTSHNIPIQL